MVRTILWGSRAPIADRWAEGANLGSGHVSWRTSLGPWQELPLRNEYLATENRILKAQLQGRLRFSDAERATLGEIGHRLGRKALGGVATAALPEPHLGVLPKRHHACSKANEVLRTKHDNQ
jgi:hypothetical protein